MLYVDDFALHSMGISASAGMHSLLGQVDEYNAATGMKAKRERGNNVTSCPQPDRAAAD